MKPPTMRDQHRPAEQWLRRNRFYNRLQWACAALAVVLAVVACDIQRTLCFPKANEWRGRRSRLSFAGRSVGARKGPEPRDDTLQRVHSPGFVLSLQIQQDMHAVALFANNPPLLHQVIVKIKDVVVTNRFRKTSICTGFCSSARARSLTSE